MLTKKGTLPIDRKYLTYNLSLVIGIFVYTLISSL